jgi:hypothetical protein
MAVAVCGEPSISGCRPACVRAAAGATAADGDGLGDALDVPICTATPAVKTRATTHAMAIGVIARRGAADAAVAPAGAAAVSGARQRGQCVRRA